MADDITGERTAVRLPGIASTSVGGPPAIRGVNLSGAMRSIQGAVDDFMSNRADADAAANDLRLGKDVQRIRDRALSIPNLAERQGYIEGQWAGLSGRYGYKATKGISKANLGSGATVQILPNGKRVIVDKSGVARGEEGELIPRKGPTLLEQAENAAIGETAAAVEIAPSYTQLVQSIANDDYAEAKKNMESGGPSQFNARQEALSGDMDAGSRALIRWDSSLAEVRRSLGGNLTVKNYETLQKGAQNDIHAALSNVIGTTVDSNYLRIMAEEGRFTGQDARHLLASLKSDFMNDPDFVAIADSGFANKFDEIFKGRTEEFVERIEAYGDKDKDRMQSTLDVLELTRKIGEETLLSGRSDKEIVLAQSEETVAAAANIMNMIQKTSSFGSGSNPNEKMQISLVAAALDRIRNASSLRKHITQTPLNKDITAASKLKATSPEATRALADSAESVQEHYEDVRNNPLALGTLLNGIEKMSNEVARQADGLMELKRTNVDGKNDKEIADKQKVLSAFVATALPTFREIADTNKDNKVSDNTATILKGRYDNLGKKDAGVQLTPSMYATIVKAMDKAESKVGEAVTMETLRKAAADSLDTSAKDAATAHKAQKDATK